MPLQDITNGPVGAARLSVTKKARDEYRLRRQPKKQSAPAPAAPPAAAAEPPVTAQEEVDEGPPAPPPAPLEVERAVVGLSAPIVQEVTLADATTHTIAAPRAGWNALTVVAVVCVIGAALFGSSLDAAVLLQHGQALLPGDTQHSDPTSAVPQREARTNQSTVSHEDTKSMEAQEPTLADVVAGGDASALALIYSAAHQDVLTMM